MDNQHRKISGYRELSQEEIDLMNEIKQKGKELGDLLEKVQEHLNKGVVNKMYDPGNYHHAEPYKWLAKAKERYQEATMFLVRAVAQPTDGM